MTERKSWAECASAGMTRKEAAAHRGVCVSTVNRAARSLGLTFAKAQNTWPTDPEYRARRFAALKAGMARSDLFPLLKLTLSERHDYNTLTRAGYSRDQAFRSINRADLIKGTSR